MCVSIYITGDDGGENYVVIMMTPVAYILAVVITIIKKGRKGGGNVHHRAQRVHTAGQSRTAGSIANKKIKLFRLFSKNNKIPCMIFRFSSRKKSQADMIKP